MMRYIIGTVIVLCFVSILRAQDSLAYKEQIEQFRFEYLSDFVQNPSAPLDSIHLKHVHFFAPNKSYLVKGKFILTPNAKPFEIPTYSGKTKPFVQYGWFVFPWENDSLRIAIYQSTRWRSIPGYGHQLFIPFMDLTNGESTYGGGRYLDITVSDIENSTLLLDFNKAYNPWCAYSDGFNCPIPPPANHLPIAIEAGEKMYSGEKLERPN